MTKYNKFSYKSKSAEERKQEIDNAMQLVEQGVKEFLTSEKYAAVLKSISKFHNYSFNNTMLSCARSLGDTPGIRPACAKVRGRIFVSFSRDSSVIVSIGA